MAWMGVSSDRNRMMGLGMFFDRFEACHRDPSNLLHIAAEIVIPTNIDYTRLRQLLDAGQWQEADLETKRILLELVDRTTDNPFRLEDVGSLTAGDLHILDRLWNEYSDGHFGYSVQQQIWQNLAEDRSIPQRIDGVIQRCGWQEGRHWRSWHRLFFSIKAPAGHLPSLVAPIASKVSQRLLLSTFLGRWEYCQNQQREAAASDRSISQFRGWHRLYPTQMLPGCATVAGGRSRNHCIAAENRRVSDSRTTVCRNDRSFAQARRYSPSIGFGFALPEVTVGYG